MGNMCTTTIVITTRKFSWLVYGANVILKSSRRRPEVMESNFIAWRATGDYEYHDRAVKTYKALQTYLPATVG